MTHQTNTDDPVDFPESRSREAFESWWQLGFAHLEVPDDYAFEIWRAAQAEMQRDLDTQLNENAEYLCVRCNCIHPTHHLRKFTQHCPVCDDVMSPTSYNLRRIKKLESQLKALQNEYDVHEYEYHQKQFD